MEDLRQGPTISGPPPVLKQHNAPSQPQASGGSADSDSAATLFLCPEELEDYGFL